MPDHVGTAIAGRYELVSVIGRGGHGVVYRAVDRVEGRGVAVKMLGDGFVHEPEYAARLAREQEALVALAGTSAVAVYDLCRAPHGSLCLVMELLEGTDLQCHLEELEARGERLSLARLNLIMEPIVETLQRAHDAEILHRDLKPANIFLLSDGEGVRLFDFGLSRQKSSAKLTVVGTIMGSPSYIAPEVWKGLSDELDHRVDVYSFGVILFRALSGHLPFEGKSLRDTFLQTTTAPRPSLYARRPDLPPALDQWVEKALAIDRSHRFETVTELWKGLLGALHYAPPPRAMRPVAESLVNAWRAATTAFRRFIPGAGSSPPPPVPALALAEARVARSRPPPIDARIDTKSIDDDWMELTDDEIESSAADATDVGHSATEVTNPDDSWEEVADAELDRRSLYEMPAFVAEIVGPSQPPLEAEGKKVPRNKKKKSSKRKKAPKKTRSKKAPKKARPEGDSLAAPKTTIKRDRRRAGSAF